jgi:hypothetical protein
VIAAADRAGVAQFLNRLLRLDATAVVRLRPEPDGAGSVWVMLPFRVLVGRRLTVAPPSDITVSASELVVWLRAADGVVPARRDEAWRWPLPPSDGRVVEIIPVAEVARLAEAAARTVRDAITEGVGGRAVGERALRDALLDHVAIVVTTDDGERVEIPQRMVQALVRTGLLREPSEVTADTVGAEAVTVRRAIGWIGISSRYGSAWYRPISPLRLR